MAWMSSQGSVSTVVQADTSIEAIDTGTGYLALKVDGAEQARVTTTGFAINSTDPAQTINGLTVTCDLTVVDENTWTFANQCWRKYDDHVWSGVSIYAARAHGTEAAPTVVSSGDLLMRLSANGHDGTDFATAAMIDVWVDGTPGDNDMPGRMTFSTTADGASSSTERMRIDNAGNVGIGSTNPSSLLHVSGSGTSDALIIESTDAGATAAPDIVFYRNSASAASSDVLGRLEFRGRNAANNADLAYAVIESTIEDATGGGEDGNITIKSLRQGSETEYLSIGKISGGNREVVFNDGGADIDFRVEASGGSNMIKVDAGASGIGFLGATPAAQRSHAPDPSAGLVPPGMDMVDLGALNTELASLGLAIASIHTTLETYGFHATS